VCNDNWICSMFHCITPSNNKIIKSMILCLKNCMGYIHGRHEWCTNLLPDVSVYSFCVFQGWFHCQMAQIYKSITFIDGFIVYLIINYFDTNCFGGFLKLNTLKNQITKVVRSQQKRLSQIKPLVICLMQIMSWLAYN